MKKLIYKIAFFFFGLFVITSCSKKEFLDIDPQGIKIPTELEDYRLLLDNSNNFIQKHGITAYASDQVFASVSLNSNLGFSEEQLNIYLYKPLIYNATINDTDWNTYYQQIFTVNLILDGLSNLKDATPEGVAKLEAEAKLHRAYAYFNLINIYSVHYNPSTAATDLGVPIREGFSLVGVDLTRASVQEVYDLIIQDISTSIDNLKDTQSLAFSFRPSKAAAYALLSKVYLYQGEYENALDNIDDALEIYDALRNFNDVEVDEGKPRYFPKILEDTQILWHKEAILDLALNEDYGNLFDEDDLRKQWLEYYPEAFEDDPVLKEVKAYFLTANQCLDCGSQGIYTPDLYLIRAECNARLANVDLANDDLNALRSRRYKTGAYTDLSVTDKDELLEIVKAERQREFPSSIERPFDIKRYNLFDNDNITVTHTYNDETVMIAPNSKNWAQPIGQLYINFNPEIKQNQRD